MRVPAFLFLVVLSACAAPPKEAPDDRLNFVVVLADDLGYGDLACFGNPSIRTPHLDRFASEGLRLTHCYAAAANCSPARTGLMTGRTPHRVGVQNWIPMFSPMHVRREEITIATLLRWDGYATCHVGKWHLNGAFNLPGQPQPSDHGFDHWFSTQNNALPNHHNPDNFVRNGEPVGDLEGYSAHLVTDEAIRWLGSIRPGDRPFFLFVCYHEPHEPIATDPEYSGLYQPENDLRRANHHGNVTQMDAAFGRLMKALDDLGLRDDTAVIFTSDNGPAITRRHPNGSAGPFRDKKGYLTEGGIRVPGIVRWPGKTRPGGVSDEPVSGVDILPTLCEAADVALPPDRALDGASFLPIFEGKPIARETPLYWHFNRARGKHKVAMRDGDWKLLATLTGPEIKPGGDLRAEDLEAIRKAELANFELYNLVEDVGETVDRAGGEPARLRRMAERLRTLYREVRDESPDWPAWKWPRYEAGRIRWED